MPQEVAAGQLTDIPEIAVEVIPPPSEEVHPPVEI
jgi:hypothetical protein